VLTSISHLEPILGETWPRTERNSARHHRDGCNRRGNDLSSRLARTSALGALAFGVISVSSAWAQYSSTSDDSVGLDEVVVTAHKREENLQTTPIAITALTARAIEELGVNNKDLFGVVSGLTGF